MRSLTVQSSLSAKRQKNENKKWEIPDSPLFLADLGSPFLSPEEIFENTSEHSVHICISLIKFLKNQVMLHIVQAQALLHIPEAFFAAL